MSYIYALIDPLTHLVRYIGQTTNLESRFRQHCSGKDSTTGAWVRSLAQPPVLAVLETVEQGQISVPRQGRRTGYVTKATIAETKWLKRFRRSVHNPKTRENCPATWDWLRNPDE
jgi:GIY-YIG catalytic domain